MMKRVLITGILTILLVPKLWAAYSIIEENGKKGLINEKGDVIIPTQYDELGWSVGIPHVQDDVIGYRINDLWGLINTKNKVVQPPTYQYLSVAGEERFVASIAGKFSYQHFYGIINERGREIVNFKYVSLKPFEDKLVARYKDGLEIYSGVIDMSGKVIVPFQYQKITPVTHNLIIAENQSGAYECFRLNGQKLDSLIMDSYEKIGDGFIKVNNNGMYGLLDANGQVVVPMTYKRVTLNTDKETANALPFPLWHFVQGDRKELSNYPADNIRVINKNLYYTAKNDLAFLHDIHLKVITSADGMDIFPYEAGYAICKKGHKYGVLDQNGHLTVDIKYDSVKAAPPYFMVKSANEGKNDWQLRHIDKELPPTKYEKITPLNKSWFMARKNGFWGVINDNGHLQVDCRYDTIKSWQKGLGVVQLLGKTGVMDSTGEWVVYPVASPIQMVNDSLYEKKVGKEFYYKSVQQDELKFTSECPVSSHGLGYIYCQDDRQGLVSFTGEKLLPTLYDTITQLHRDSVFFAIHVDKGGYVFDQGLNVIHGGDKRLTEMYGFNEAYIGVKIDGKYGFIDLDGNLRIANRYDSVTYFKDGLAGISIRNHWGFINKAERIQVQPRFDYIEHFHQGLCRVMKDGQWGLVDKQGDEVLAIKYDTLWRIPSGKYITKQGDAYGLVNANGFETIYPRYQSIEDTQNGYLIVQRNDKYGLITEDGVSTLPTKYTTVRYNPYNDIYLAKEKPQWEEIPLRSPNNP